MKLTGHKNVIWKEGKYYVAQSLHVDVSSFGKTKKEALSALREALELFFEDEKSIRLRTVLSPQIVTM